MEYEYAVEHGIPVASFLLRNEERAKLPANKVEQKQRGKIDEFRKLSEKKLVKFWRNSDDLGSKVALALNELMKNKPRTGWIRGDNLPSQNVTDEIAALSKEKRRLQARVDELESQNNSGTNYLDLAISEMQKTKLEKYFGTRNSIQANSSLLFVFLEVAEELTFHADTYYIKEKIDQLFGDVFDNDDVYILLRDLVAFDLVERDADKYGLDRFKLTKAGKNVLLKARHLAELEEN